MPKATYPIDTICKMLDLTDRRVQQLAKEGVLPKTEKGKYDLVGCVRGYVHYLRDRALGKDADLDGFQWRDRKLKAEALMAEMELYEMRKELVNVASVSDYLERMFSSFKQHILGMPTKVAPMVAAETDINGVKLVLEGEAHDLLGLIANYEPEDGTEPSDGCDDNPQPGSESTEESQTTETSDGN